MVNHNRQASAQTIHAINMCKFLHVSDASMLPTQDDWLILGHFDSLSIAEIGSVSKATPHILEQVWNDFCKLGEYANFNEPKERSYRHVLYLLPAESELDVKQLSQNFPFMFVTRIRKSNGYEDIEEQQSMSDTVKSIMEPDREFLCYPALGLSDLVLVMFSDSLERLLEKVERLLFCPYIGDTYTYCCVSKHVIGSSDIKIEAEDKVPLISMRLAVHSTKKAEQWIKYWRTLERKTFQPCQKSRKVVDEAYVVTGTADIKMLIQDISSYAFVQFLHEILMDNKHPIWDAFDDLITRLGGKLPENLDEKPCISCNLDCRDPGKPQNTLYSAFIQENEHLLKRIKDIQASWIKPLIELMNSFIYLSKNRVLDQLCYVLLSSVQGFVVKLQENDDKFGYMTDLYTFVDGLAFVEEHTIRQESQLVLHPETRPMLFSLPVNTIESYLTFIDLCADFLQLNDSYEQKKKFFFLIVPCLCEKVTVRSLLYKQEERNHLLYIKVPLEHCYSPKEVAQALAHEIGHYSGECPRKRSKRFKMLLWCCAYFFCKQLNLGSNTEGKIFCLNRIRDRLLREIPEGHRQFMKMIELSLEVACLSLIHDEKFIYMLRDEMVRREEDPQNRFDMQVRIDTAYEHMRETDGVYYVLDVMKEVQMLSQECYADIAMFSLLDVNALDYIQLIWKRRNSGLEKQDKEIHQISEALLLERISLAILVARSNDVENLFAQRENTELDAEIKTWIQMIVAYCTALKEKRWPTDDIIAPILPNLHPPGVTAALLQYLKECYAAMPKKEVSVQGEEISELYQSLIEFYDNTESNQEKAINKYRSKIIAWSVDGRKPDNLDSITHILGQAKDGILSATDAVNALVCKFHLSVESATALINLETQ